MATNQQASPPTRPTPSLPAALGAAWRWVRRAGIGGQIVILAIVVAIFAIGTRGKYLEWPNIQVILSLAGIPVILAIGLHQSLILGEIDLSVEGIAGLAIIFVGMLVRNKYNSNDIGLWIIPIVLVIGGAAGMVNGLVHTKLRIPSFISTLGMSWTLYGIAVYINKATTIPLLDTRIQNVVNGKVLDVPLIASSRSPSLPSSR